MKEILLANPPILYLAFIGLATVCGFLLRCLWVVAITRVKNHEEQNTLFQEKMGETIEGLNAGIGELTTAIKVIPLEFEKKLGDVETRIRSTISSTAGELHEKINENVKDLEMLKGVCKQRGETCLSKHPRFNELVQKLLKEKAA